MLTLDELYKLREIHKSKGENSSLFVYVNRNHFIELVDEAIVSRSSASIDKELFDL